MKKKNDIPLPYLKLATTFCIKKSSEISFISTGFSLIFSVHREVIEIYAKKT